MSGGLSGWSPRPEPGHVPLAGYGVRLEPFEAHRHGSGLYAAIGADPELWRYLPVGPYGSPDDLCAMYEGRRQSGWCPLVIFAEDNDEPLGSFSFMRLRPEHGSVELGCVVYGPRLRRTRAGTAAFFLATAHVFDLGYRRYEWKCNAQNAASGRAALRYGFAYEGRFRQDMVLDGINRDTDWYSMIDSEWPARKVALEAWLDESNFDEAGRQRTSLGAFQERSAD